MNEEHKHAWDEEIKGRQRLFVLNYCTSELFFMNGRQAYIAAYTKIKDGKPVKPKEETADVNASRLLSNAKVKNAAAKLLAELQPDVDRDNSYKLLHDLFLQATYNPADIIDSKGRLKVKRFEDLGDMAKCVEQIEPSQYGLKVKLASRKFAQDKLLKYYDLVREMPEIAAALPVVYLSQKEETLEDWNKKYGDGGE